MSQSHLQITLYGHRLLQDCGSVVPPVKDVNENQILARKCTPKTKVFLNWKMYVENSSALGGYHTCDGKDNCDGSRHSTGAKGSRHA